MKHFYEEYFFYIVHLMIILSSSLLAQNHFPGDPFYLLQYEKRQFEGKIPMNSNIFRPIFFKSDSTTKTITLRNEFYLNNNAPNQENMDVRYFSKGLSNFSSLNLSINTNYFIFMIEPFVKNDQFYKVQNIDRSGVFSVLNDNSLSTIDDDTFRNLLAFVHYKGFGIGYHKGNRWWGPGIHTSLQMTNNTAPMPSNIIGTIREIRFGPIGIFGFYSFTKMNEKHGFLAKYFTSLNAEFTWYGSANLSLGFSRNYLSGGVLSNNYEWTKKDAQRIIFEGIFTQNLLSKEYTIGGHDIWDQTLSGYLVITLPNRDIKAYAEVGFNDNRLYFADFLSQPDHSMATIIGIRDYGLGNNKNIIWGMEWTNLMVSYTSRHRGSSGSVPWYSRELYDYSSYKGRRWGAHSGGDSDDWFFYAGYLSEKIMVVPAFNYERHGIVSNRPAEVKLEFRLDSRFKYKEIWMGVYLEKQFESFLGFPDYFYVDDQGAPVDYHGRHKLANSRNTSTLIFYINKTINF